jgi:hypothetical protein
VKRTFWLAALALPLAAQPKLLIDAKPDSRSAAAGLEPVFRAILAAQPQPAWIGYLVPAVRTYGLGCEFVSREDGTASGPGAGVVHLEPPDHAVVLFRVTGNAVERIRALSPDCEIDAGGVPFHWLTEVEPAQSVALLSGLVEQMRVAGAGAIHAIAMHSDAAADRALDRFLAGTEPESIRVSAVGAMGSTRGPRGVETLKNLIANDPDERVRRRAVSALQSLPGGQGVPLLIELVKTSKSPDIRKQAMSALENTHDPRALAFFEQVLK